VAKGAWSQGLQTRSAALGHAGGEHAQFDRASWSTGQ